MKRALFIVVSSLAIFGWNSKMEGVPTFARNLGLDCTTCHTAYPQLTEFGKIFLESAGDMLIQKDFGSLKMITDIASGHLLMDPIDKRFSKDSRKEHLPRRARELRNHALEEADLYLAGRTGDVFYFVIIESDRSDDFSTYVSQGYVAYRFCNNLNIFAGWASPYVLDANDTVYHANAFIKQWKAADYVPGTSQMLGVNWKHGNSHGILAWHGDDDQASGIDPKHVSFRLNYDWGHQTFGTYISYGKHWNDDEERSKGHVLLYGVDAHLRYKNSNIMMLLGFRNNDDKKMDFDFSLDANKIYTIEDKCLKNYLTSVIPMINFNFFQDRLKSPGTWITGVAGVAFYINPAIRVLPTIEGTLMAPSSYKHKTFRALIQADVGL